MTLQISKQAIAGTLESSDLQIIIDQNVGNGIDIELNSSVKKQYGKQIEAVIKETLANLGITEAKLVVEDRGSLDCTVIARTIAVVHRSSGITENYDWEGIEKWNV
ncbi:citrate lyase acyl carrier protein [Carnobacterium pleistocenium]|uniref:citrate lyase acyl carrier protein n=1 Tax=Carnobacterium pleistocenium TaxID=181073 RepID=UPI00054D0452|nr:citrate lyase acyl carrier protein [Carnobacterium pleistocenium]